MTENTAETPRIISEETIYEGRIVSLSRIQLEMPGGVVVQREIVRHLGSVGILPITAEGKFIFVRQFRPPAGRRLLELPAGSLEPDEDPEACALRELQEEIGLTASSMRKLAAFYLAPGWATEYMHGFVATGLTPQTAQGDEDEVMEVIELSPSEALAAIHSGEIADCKSIALIGLYLAGGQGAAAPTDPWLNENPDEEGG